MNKEDNPFYTIAQQLKPPHNATVQTINLGTIISVSPLLINCNGIQLDRQDLLINKDLLKSTIRKVKINANTVNGNVITKYGGNLDSFNMEDGIIENLKDGFKAGSTVLLLTQDNQKFYLVCEVV